MQYGYKAFYNGKEADIYAPSLYAAKVQAVRERSNLANFTIWQKLNTILTGECVAFLPAGEAQ